MEIRKIQRVGQSTLSITLPKRWVKEYSLKIGDVVMLNEGNDGSLILVPGNNKEISSNMECQINGDLYDDTILARVIIASYLRGFESIRVVWSEKVNDSTVEVIRKLIQRLNGFGILEQTDNKILLQSFIDHTKFSYGSLIRRMYMVAESMCDLIEQAIEHKRKRLAEEVLNLGEESDKLYYLITRHISLGVKHFSTGKRTKNHTKVEMLNSRTAIKTLEEICDSLENISKAVVVLLDLKIRNKNFYKEHLEICKDIRRLIHSANEASIGLNVVLANEILQETKNIEERLFKFMENLENSREDVKVVTSMIKMIMEEYEICKFINVLANDVIDNSIIFPSEQLGVSFTGV